MPSRKDPLRFLRRAVEWVDANARNREGVYQALAWEPDTRGLAEKTADLLAEQAGYLLERGRALRAVLTDRCEHEYSDLVLQSAYTAKAVLCILLLPQRPVPTREQVLAGEFGHERHYFGYSYQRVEVSEGWRRWAWSVAWDGESGY